LVHYSGAHQPIYNKEITTVPLTFEIFSPAPNTHNGDFQPLLTTATQTLTGHCQGSSFLFLDKLCELSEQEVEYGCPQPQFTTVNKTTFLFGSYSFQFTVA